jgi:ubiquinone/menaquinone biosynthesis C-methylase UbiE
MGDYTAFSSSVPENYDRYMGPMLFEPYAADIVARLRVFDGMRVLEVACGTGIVTQALLGRLPEDSTLLATDLSEPMLALAQVKVAPDPRLQWRTADALALPFSDGSFEAVICQFGLMFVPDKIAAIREMRRVLVEGGQLLLNTWDALAQNDFCRVAHETQATFFESDPPAFFETPFSLHDGEQLLAWMREAGFEDPRVRHLDLPTVSPSAADAAKGLVQGTPLSVALTERGADVNAIRDAVAAAVAEQFGEAPARGRMRALICEAGR